MSDLSFHIRQFVPRAEGEELQQRELLLKLRDYAAALLGSLTSQRAYEHAQDAHEAAGAFVFADASAVHLKVAAQYCRNLIVAAMRADQLDGEGGEA